MSFRYLKENDDGFWSENPKILIEKSRLIEFIPTSDMSWKERLNALSRLFCYCGILLLLYLGKSWPIYIILFGMLTTLILFKNSPVKKMISTKNPTEYPTTNSPNPFIPKNQPKCIAPTRDNPFMNVLQTEYLDNPTRPSACDYDDVKDKIEHDWSYNLYRDVGDSLWDRANSQRQFFTMPWTTIPNDQGSFANWLYKTGPVCKTDQTACLRYEDLRANRGPVTDSEYLS